MKSEVHSKLALATFWVLYLPFNSISDKMGILFFLSFQNLSEVSNELPHGVDMPQKTWIPMLLRTFESEIST